MKQKCVCWGSCNKNLMTCIKFPVFLAAGGGHMEIQQTKYPVLAAALSVK